MLFYHIATVNEATQGGFIMEKLNGEKLNIEQRTPIKMGSIVKVLLTYSPDDTEEISVLVGKRNNGDSEDQIVDVDTPLGECIFGKYAGDITSFMVRSTKVMVKILAVT